MFVFLDLDGVLATNDSYKWWNAIGRPKDKHPLDRKLVKMLDGILIEAGANVILSTSWRLDHNFGLQRTIEHLQDAGLTANIIGSTTLGECRYPHPLYPGQTPRGHEILQEIEDRNLKLSEIIILDDDLKTKWVPKGKPSIGGRWIQTPEPTGMGPKHFRKLRSMLGLP